MPSAAKWVQKVFLGKVLILLSTIGFSLFLWPWPAVSGELRARLVNKRVIGAEGPVGFSVGQVEVTFPDGRTKLLPYQSYLEPLTVGDQVFILPTEDLQLTRIFIYHAKTDKTASYRLPLDLDPYFGSPSFSPDGKKIAYYQVKEGRVVVRSWPGLKLLRRSPSYPVRPTDVPPEPPAWKSPTLVKFDPYFFMPERRIAFELSL